MSDVPQGPGWWQASDGKWYPPEAFGASQQQPPPGPVADQVYGYGPTGYGPAKTEPLAVWALVLGIAGLPLACLCFVGLFGSIAAIPLGFVARRKIRDSNGALTGDGMALAGAICGIASVVIYVGFLVLWGLSIFALDSGTTLD